MKTRRIYRRKEAPVEEQKKTNVEELKKNFQYKNILWTPPRRTPRRRKEEESIEENKNP